MASSSRVVYFNPDMGLLPDVAHGVLVGGGVENVVGNIVFSLFDGGPCFNVNRIGCRDVDVAVIIAAIGASVVVAAAIIALIGSVVSATVVPASVVSPGRALTFPVAPFSPAVGLVIPEIVAITTFDIAFVALLTVGSKYLG